MILHTFIDVHLFPVDAVTVIDLPVSGATCFAGSLAYPRFMDWMADGDLLYSEFGEIKPKDCD